MNSNSFAIILLWFSWQVVAGEASYVESFGRCEKKIKTDRSGITMTVQAEGKKLDTLTKAVNTKYKNLVREIKKLGFKENQIQTSLFRINRENDWIKGKRVFRGFRVSSSLQIEAKKLELISKALEVAGRLNIDEVGQLVQFASTELVTKTKDACLKVATYRAKVKAEEMAKSLGKMVKGWQQVRELSRGEHQAPQVHNAMEMKSAALSSSNQPSLQQASQVLFVEVVGKFQIR